MVCRFPPSLEGAIQRYVSFYQYVVREKAFDVLLVSFEEAVENIEKTICRIDQLAELNIKNEDIYNLKKRAKNRIKKNTRKRGVMRKFLFPRGGGKEGKIKYAKNSFVIPSTKVYSQYILN